MQTKKDITPLQNKKDITPYNDEGIPHGYWKIYHPVTGNIIREESYVNGRMNGCWKFYYSCGILLSTQHYVSNELHGYYACYDINNKAVIIGNYVNGYKKGFWFEYDKKFFYAN